MAPRHITYAGERSMIPDSPSTMLMQQLVDRIRAGDAAARNELVRGYQERLCRLARKMLKKFPHVRRWVDAEDVFQSAVLRLLRALETVRPDSTKSLFMLASTQMRRELIDLARHFYGPEGLGANYDSIVPGLRDGAAPPEPSDHAPGRDELEKWCRFHEAVERLPVEEREVVGLIYYHGWEQARVAELFQVSDRTVRRWWDSAMNRLRAELADAGP